MTIAFKGRSVLKQYDPKKPDKWGFKAFVLSESKSGYVLDWTLYAGKTENVAAADDDAGVTHRIVRSLMADHIGKGHELYIDSYYTGVPIAVELSTQLSQYMSSVVGSGRQCSPDVKQLITWTIGPQPIIQATIGGVTVDCLVDDWPTPYHTSYDRWSHRRLSCGRLAHTLSYKLR